MKGIMLDGHEIIVSRNAAQGKQDGLKPKRVEMPMQNRESGYAASMSGI